MTNHKGTAEFLPLNRAVLTVSDSRARAEAPVMRYRKKLPVKGASHELL